MELLSLLVEASHSLNVLLGLSLSWLHGNSLVLDELVICLHSRDESSSSVVLSHVLDWDVHWVCDWPLWLILFVLISISLLFSSVKPKNYRLAAGRTAHRADYNDKVEDAQQNERENCEKNV